MKYVHLQIRRRIDVQVKTHVSSAVKIKLKNIRDRCDRDILYFIAQAQR